MGGGWNTNYVVKKKLGMDDRMRIQVLVKNLKLSFCNQMKCFELQQPTNEAM